MSDKTPAQVATELLPVQDDNATFTYVQVHNLISEAVEDDRSDRDKYNGWANRETWALMLHINNDMGLQEEFVGLVTEQDDSAEWLIEDEIKYRVETLLVPSNFRDNFGERQTDELAAMASEVGSLWRIDWAEVRASLQESAGTL